MVSHSCRKLEVLVVPRVSIEAKRTANERGIGDLSESLTEKEVSDFRKL